jgi:ketosteroid isomerase-like protein
MDRAGLSEAKQKVLRLLDAMGARDAAAIDGLVNDDVQWWIPQSVENAGAVERPVKGRSEVVRLASGQMFGAFQPNTTTWDVWHMTEEEGRVAILMYRRATGANGKPYNNLYHWLFRLESGRISEVWEVLDTALAAQELAP